MPKPRKANSPMSTIITTTTLYLSLSLILSLLVIQTHFWVCNGVSVSSLAISNNMNCSSENKIGECSDEFVEMDSEINRRVLAMGKRYISYETLRRDMVPCGRPGAPYYNCHVGPVNPYSRGCEIITGCRGTIKEIHT